MEETIFTVGQERLRQLYAMLAGVPKERFDLYHWREAKEPEFSDEPFDVADHQILHDCGTTACAVGWACSYPPFINQGLMFRAGGPVFHGGTGGIQSSGWSAVSQFFEVSEMEAAHLFDHRNYKNGKRASPSEVRRRILDYLKRTGAIGEARFHIALKRDDLADVRP